MLIATIIYRKFVNRESEALHGLCLQSLADEFYQTYNDQAFNSIEPEICHLVYVASVESVLSSDVSELF